MTDLIPIVVHGYWKDNGITFTHLSAIGGEADAGDEDDYYFYYFDSTGNVVGDHGDFVVTAFTYEDVSLERYKFEQWVFSQVHLGLGKLEHSGAYEDEDVALAWDAWQAAVNHHKGD